MTNRAQWLLLSSTSLIYFCCDVIPFTFHFTQQEGAYAIFIRSWALLHGLFSGTINQCISLHCRLFFFFFPHKSIKCAIAHGCKFLWVPRHTLCCGLLGPQQCALALRNLKQHSHGCYQSLTLYLVRNACRIHLILSSS